MLTWMQKISEKKDSMGRFRHHLLKTGIVYLDNPVSIIAQAGVQIAHQLFKMPGDGNPHVEHISASRVLAFESCDAICASLQQFDQRVKLRKESVMSWTWCEIRQESFRLNKFERGSQSRNGGDIRLPSRI